MPISKEKYDKLYEFVLLLSGKANDPPSFTGVPYDDGFFDGMTALGKTAKLVLESLDA